MLKTSKWKSYLGGIRSKKDDLAANLEEEDLGDNSAAKGTEQDEDQMKAVTPNHGDRTTAIISWSCTLRLWL
eukprot:jgi/Psemu1/25202/gm1.25202_g